MGISRAAAVPSAAPAQTRSRPSRCVTSSGRADTHAVIAALSTTKTASSRATSGRRTASTMRSSGVWASTAGRGATVRPRIIAMVMPKAATAMPAIAQSTARSPSSPMRKAASGGPATQASENTALVRMTSCTDAPVERWWAKISPMPTPAGPPSETSAMTAAGSVFDSARAVTSSTVKTPHHNNGRR